MSKMLEDFKAGKLAIEVNGKGEALSMALAPMKPFSLNTLSGHDYIMVGDYDIEGEYSGRMNPDIPTVCADTFLADLREDKSTYEKVLDILGFKVGDRVKFKRTDGSISHFDVGKTTFERNDLCITTIIGYIITGIYEIISVCNPRQIEMDTIIADMEKIQEECEKRQEQYERLEAKLKKLQEKG